MIIMITLFMIASVNLGRGEMIMIYLTIWDAGGDTRVAVELFLFDLAWP
jgi:hypothetical protein